MDVVSQPRFDSTEIEVTGFHEPDDDVVMTHRVTGQLKTVHSEVNVGSGHGGPLVSIEERMILNQTLEERGSFGHRISVVTRLRAEYRRLERTEITHTLSAAELVDHD